MPILKIDCQHFVTEFYRYDRLLKRPLIRNPLHLSTLPLPLTTFLKPLPTHRNSPPSLFQPLLPRDHLH